LFEGRIARVSVDLGVRDWARTVHGIGDLHAGAIRRTRAERVLDDVAVLQTPALHLQIGDITEDGTADQDREARSWLAGLPGPHRTILGNHDILRNRRTPAQWARAYGYRSKNYVVDLPFVRVIAVGPDRADEGRRSGELSEATLAWLEEQLADADGDCWVACHWPLYRTVMGDPRRHFTSAMQSFHVKPDHEIRALLARQRNARAWLSGHTHSPLHVPGLVTRVRLARRRVVLSVNLSALVGVGKVRDPRDPLCSAYLTHRPGTIQVRFRDHRARRWRPCNPNGRRS
jgi:3',5'-cyclic AMP phosphodiesterase CpdA